MSYGHFRSKSISLALFLSIVWGCSPPVPPVAATPPPPVTVSQPVAREVVDRNDYEGRIAAVQTVEARARVRGHLIKVSFKDGELVKQGDLLFEIDPLSRRSTCRPLVLHALGAMRSRPNLQRPGPPGPAA
jgi:multidrug efflux pump subunit AcrA (membrane-fusion protein)